MRRSLRNTIFLHIYVHGAIKRGDVRVRALQKVQDGRVQVHVSVENAGDIFAAPQVATAAQLHLHLRRHHERARDFSVALGALVCRDDGGQVAASRVAGGGRRLAPWPPAAAREQQGRHLEPKKEFAGLKLRKA